MGKQTIRLTEKQFNNLVKESVKRIVETYGDERMQWDNDFISELADYAEAQQLTDNLMSDTNFGDIQYNVSDDGYRLTLTFETPEDANDFEEIMDGAVGEYDFLRNPNSDNTLILELPA